MSKVAKTGATLHGLVTDVQVFNRMLTEEENMGYTKCSIELTGDIASWGNTRDWEKVGDIGVLEVDSKQICSDHGSLLENVMIMPALLNYKGMYLKK